MGHHSRLLEHLFLLQADIVIDLLTVGIALERCGVYPGCSLWREGVERWSKLQCTFSRHATGGHVLPIRRVEYSHKKLLPRTVLHLASKFHLEVMTFLRAVESSGPCRADQVNETRWHSPLLRPARDPHAAETALVSTRSSPPERCCLKQQPLLACFSHAQFPVS
eukprot:5129749-Amphidinium_carterae.1